MTTIPVSNKQWVHPEAMPTIFPFRLFHSIVDGSSTHFEIVLFWPHWPWWFAPHAKRLFWVSKATICRCPHATLATSGNPLKQKYGKVKYTNLYKAFYHGNSLRTWNLLYILLSSPNMQNTRSCYSCCMSQTSWHLNKFFLFLVYCFKTFISCSLQKLAFIIIIV